jgi:hypothetical protein
MIKHLGVVVAFGLALGLVAGCGGGDKCDKVYDKLAPMMEKEAKAKPDRAKMVGKCRDELKAHPEKAKEMDCILGLGGSPTMGDLMACAEGGKAGDNAGGAEQGFKDYQNKSKAAEAKLMLDRIGKNAKRVFAETAAFPKGTAALTPATECCKGEGGKCAVDSKQWTVEPWASLEFSVDDPHRFRYSYDSSDGKTFTATAVGDVACDGNAKTYTLKGSVDASGNPKVDLVEP